MCPMRTWTRYSHHSKPGMIEVELFGQLADNGSRLNVNDLPLPTTALRLAVHLKINQELVGIITIDGKQSQWTDKIYNGSRVCYFPYLAGG